MLPTVHREFDSATNGRNKQEEYEIGSTDQQAIGKGISGEVSKRIGSIDVGGASVVRSDGC